jgi:hypothetical protein
VDLYFHVHLVPSRGVPGPVSVLDPGLSSTAKTAGPARSRDPEGAAENFFWEGRNLRGGRALTPWNGLYDPLSSFVPVLEPRPRRGFSFGARAAAGCATAAVVSAESVVVGSRIPEPGSAGVTTCGRDRGRAKFPFCFLL